MELIAVSLVSIRQLNSLRDAAREVGQRLGQLTAIHCLITAKQPETVFHYQPYRNL